MPACVPLVNVHWLYRHSTQTKTDTLWKYIFKWLHTWKGHCTDYKALQGSHTHKGLKIKQKQFVFFNIVHLA